MANARAQVGLDLDEKSGFCVRWNAGHVCWVWCEVYGAHEEVGASFATEGPSNGIEDFVGSCCVCNWRDWKLAVVSRMNGWPLLYMGKVKT